MRSVSCLKSSVLRCIKSESSKPSADAELEKWAREGQPNERRTDAVRAIEDAAKYRSPRVMLSRLALESLPSSMSRLGASVELDASQNQLAKWPAELGGLSQLKRLDISRNKISMLPAAISAHKQLKKLNASNNCLRATGLHDEVSRLRDLTALDLSNNKLNAVPEVILGLPRLKKLNLANNSITALPAMDSLHSLKELDLSKNALGFIPDGPEPGDDAGGSGRAVRRAANLPFGLETLKLAGTMLEDIPASVALPEHVGRLRQLKFLDVSGNSDLHKLPIGFRTFKTTDNPHKLKSSALAVELTVLHEGTQVARGLVDEGRLIGADKLKGKDAATSETSDTSGAGGMHDREAYGNALARHRRRTARAAKDAAAAAQAGPWPETVDNSRSVPIAQPATGMHAQPPAGMYAPPATGMHAHAAAMQGFPPGLQTQVPGAGGGVYPPPAPTGFGTAGPATTTSAMPSVNPAFQHAGAGGAPGAAVQPGNLPGMPFLPTGFGPQAGGMDSVQAQLMQMGIQYMELQLAQWRSAIGIAPQPVGLQPNPYAAPPARQAFGAAPMPAQSQPLPAAQYATVPPWAAPPPAQPLPPDYDAEHEARMRRRNEDVTRDLQLHHVCQTIPPLVTDRGIDELVQTIKANAFSTPGLTQTACRAEINHKLVQLARGLYHQRLVDEAAKRDACSLASSSVDALSLSIAYQALLAVPLDLPGPIRGLASQLDLAAAYPGCGVRTDLFDGLLSQPALFASADKVLMEVRQMEAADPGDKLFNQFRSSKKFWQEHCMQEGAYIRGSLHTNLR